MSKTIWLLPVWCALAFSATDTTSASATKKKTAKRVVHASAAKSTAVHPAVSTRTKSTQKTAASKSSASSARSRSSKSTTARRFVRSYQQAPTPDRYREIQQALINKGYLQGEATGTWGPDSVDALKRFQAEQNLTADGKISSLSLIALGLGPKRLTAQSSAQPVAPPANPVNPINSTTPSNSTNPPGQAVPVTPANPATNPAVPPGAPGPANPLANPASSLR